MKPVTNNIVISSSVNQNINHIVFLNSFQFILVYLLQKERGVKWQKEKK